MSAQIAFDRVWKNGRIATMQGSGAGVLEDAAIAANGSEIVWVGPSSELPRSTGAVETIDCRDSLVTPGLIDCHTHLVFAGNRAHEFEQRLNGVSYEQIAKAGGGIVSTVRATRAADEEALYRQSEARLKALMREGVTTVEIKSGYGLDVVNEMKSLRVARELGVRNAVSVRTTFLGAHAVPPEYAGRADDYIDLVCGEMMDAVVSAGLADMVDAFCENIGFTVEQTKRVFEAAVQHQLPVKLHAEQLSDQQGAVLAANYKALSADHLEYLDARGIAAMAGAGMVAVLLPGAFYFLREKQHPPIAALRAANVDMAVASDLNPGTSPIASLQANMHIASTVFRLTPVEVLRGVTVNAARALGLADRGVIAAGKRADICVWDLETPAELCYWLGGVVPRQMFVGGAERHG
ncbi:MAG: imidazolonepropionase [Betaproteobacteria bacterium]|nr:imidazolonepropionase [Betaproteobacteria bacterium]